MSAQLSPALGLSPSKRGTGGAVLAGRNGVFFGFFAQGLSISLALFTQTLPEGNKLTSADLIFDALAIANFFLSQQ